MKRFIRKKLPYILIAVQAVLILGILFYIVPGRYRLYNIVLYDAAENVPPNPLIGYAPDAERQEDCAQTDLVFIRLPFSEWEPQEGVFAVKELEEKYHVRAYREAGKHAVLRFVCDVPGPEAHRDIPDWLYERTGGAAYDDDSGKGCSPDYGDEAFLAAHEKALQALADWCLQDDFVAYVEIGSVGPDGIWDPADPSAAARIPSGGVLSRFAQQYAACFPAESGIRLLNSAGAEMAAGGSWNDVLGDGDAARKWIAESVEYAPGAEKAAGTKNAGKRALAASGDAAPESLWTRNPVGGGMTGSIGMDDLLMDSLSETLEQIRHSHLSFIGPVCPDAAQQQTNGSEMILRNVGYCIYLSRLQTTVDFIRDELELHFTFENIGNAPMYWDWPVTMYIYDPEGTCIREQTLDLKLSDLLPDRELTVTGTIPYSGDLLRGFRAGISIRSPDGSRYITLAQKGILPDREGIHKVYLSPRKY